MSITDNLKDIRSEVQAAEQVKDALSSKLKELEYEGPSSPSLDKPHGNAIDKVSQDVINKEELKGLYQEVEEAELKLTQRADTLRERLKNESKLDVLHRMLLEMYYLDGKTMTAIAKTMRKGRSSCNRILHEAIDQISEDQVEKKTTKFVRMDEDGNTGRASKAS